MKIFTPDQVRAWDKYTVEHEPIWSIDLMERAAAKCSDWISNRYETGPFKIFCGKGNNGGDGLAIARQLNHRGYEVQVFILEFGKPGTDDFQQNLQRLHQFNLPLNYIQNESSLPAIKDDEIIIECLYASGLNKPLEGLAATLVNHINNAGVNVIAIDIPAGMFAGKTSEGNAIVKATYTLTFETTKTAFLLPENEMNAGEVIVLDIGLHPAFELNEQANFQLIDAGMIGNIFKPRKRFSHKGTFGHSLIIAGSKGKMGACILASRACLRSGTGLVTAVVPEFGLPIIQTTLPEAMAVCNVDLEGIDVATYQAAGIGPGLGTDHKAAALFKNFLQSYNMPMVVDADALNLLSKNHDWLKHVPANSILTPHPKEFERLFGRAANDFERLNLALENAAKLSLIIVLKGHHTFIACPNGEGYFNSTGNAGMATAGSGDALTGILTGLLSQGYAPHHAAMFGVYLHGIAGDIAAKKTSQEAMTAGDIIRCLGYAFQRI